MFLNPVTEVVLERNSLYRSGDTLRDQLDFIDLIILEKLEKSATLEGFGGQLNSSFFETAALLGNLQVKKLIEIKSAIGRSTASRTKLGSELLLHAISEGDEPLDELDHTILKSLAAGANTFQRVKEDINLSSKDAAIRLYKLVRKNYADYEIRNAKLTLSLTEGGFKLTGFVPKKQQSPEMVRKPILSKTPVRPITPPESQYEKTMVGSEDATSKIPEPSPEQSMQLTKAKMAQAKSAYMLKKYSPAAIIIIIILVIVYALNTYGYINLPF